MSDEHPVRRRGAAAEAGGAAKRTPHGQSPAEGTAFERVIFFSDAVFAIAITVLVLELHVPELPRERAPAELLPQLWALWPRFLGYFVSFVVIGLYWLGHHRLFRYIVRFDTGLIMLNLLVLLTVAFLPFPTAVLSTYDNTQVAVVFYILSLTVCVVVLWLLWWYAAGGHRLVDPALDPRTIRYLGLRVVSPLLAYLPALAVSFVSPRAATQFLLVVLVITLVNALVLDRRYLPHD
jgi:uncharacterized membrane protein